MFENVLVASDAGRGTRDALALANLLAAPGGHAVVDYRDLTALEQAHPDLLVVAGTRPGPFARSLLAAGMRSSVLDAQCAIAVAPPGFAVEEPRLRRIGVGYDGTLNGERALIAARPLAARHGASIEAVWIVSLRAVHDSDPVPSHWPDAAGKLIAHRSKALRALPDVDGRALFGSPRDELERLSDEVDLLVVGSRGYGELGRRLHGSVSGHLATHARSPLLVIPPTAELGKLYRHGAVPSHTALSA
jgi:nucleotide-binding universal stress UspA family protein